MSDRLLEIKKTIDELIRRIETWLGTHDQPVMPDTVVVAIKAAVMTMHQGDIPRCCQQLNTAVNRLHVEYLGYEGQEHGKYRPENGSPGPSFWAAAQELAKARHGAEEPTIERLEPVKVLLTQGVSHEQIAQHIYGRRGVGPFIDQYGCSDYALIEREAANPGSVVPENWVPPWHTQFIEQQKKKLEGQLKAFEVLETGRKYEDPATVEELLAQGAFVQQIELVKGVSRAEILKIAKREGLKAVDGPSYQPELRVLEKGKEGKEGKGEKQEKPVKSSSPAGASTDTTSDSDNELRDLVIDLFRRSQGEKGAAEISRELKSTGVNIHTNKVSVIIGQWKRKQAEAIGANAGGNAAAGGDESGSMGGPGDVGTVVPGVMVEVG